MTSKAAPASLISKIRWRILPAIVVAVLLVAWFAWPATHHLLPNELQDRLYRQAGPYVEMTLADYRGRQIVSNRSAIDVSANTDALAVFDDAPEQRYGSNPDFDSHAFDGDGQYSAWAVMLAGIPEFYQLHLPAAERLEKALAPAGRLGLFVVISSMMSIATLIVAIAATAMMATRPIQSFIGDVEEITRTGDPGQRVRAEDSREVHRLAGAFNRMLESLQSTAALRDTLRSLNAGLAEANLALDQANANLERGKARFQLAVDSALAGIWHWGARTDTLFWSDRMKRMVGVDGEDFDGRLTFFKDARIPRTWTC